MTPHEHNVEKAGRFRGLWRRRAERQAHNDRDYDCRYWWGDRGGYDLVSQRCLVCNPSSLSSEKEN